MEVQVRCSRCEQWMKEHDRMICSGCLQTKVRQIESELVDKEVKGELAVFYGLVRKFIEDPNEFNRMMVERRLP